MTKSTDALLDRERIAWYRELGAEALRHARAASTDAHRAAFLEIARSWVEIARDVERRTRRQKACGRLQAGDPAGTDDSDTNTCDTAPARSVPAQPFSRAP